MLFLGDIDVVDLGILLCVYEGYRYGYLREFINYLKWEMLVMLFVEYSVCVIYE